MHSPPRTNGTPDTRGSKDESDEFVTHCTKNQNPDFIEHLQPPDFVGPYHKEQKNQIVQPAAQLLLERVLPAPAISPICHATDDTTIACLIKENGT